jgi:ABC-type branched-subunit amino acid transport system ATPase component
VFENLTISNFRAITELRVNDLGAINLFVGKNNCGKTTFLEGLFFLVGGTDPQMPPKVTSLRGIRVFGPHIWRTFFHEMNVDTTIEIRGRLRESQELQTLRVSPIKKGEEAEVLEEETVPVGSDSGNSKALPALRGLRATFSSSAQPGIARETRLTLREGKLTFEGFKEGPITGVFLTPASAFGDESVDRFTSVQRAKRIPEIVSALGRIDSRVTDLRLTRGDMIEADVGMLELILVKLLGAGMARFLSIALAMLDSRDGIVLIDEIETGLQPSAQRTLWDAISDWSRQLNVQVFATTHSSECIQAFSDSIQPALFGVDAKLYRIQREGKKFGAIEYTLDSLAESLESGWEVR